MILRHCKACKRDLKLSRLTCSCGSVDNDSFKAVIVVPGSKGKRRSRTSQTLKGAKIAELDLKREALEGLQPVPQTPPPHSWPPASPYPYGWPQQPPQPSQQPKEPTFHQMWKHYHAYSKLRKPSWKADRIRYTKNLNKPLGHLRASQVRAVGHSDRGGWMHP